MNRCGLSVVLMAILGLSPGAVRAQQTPNDVEIAAGGALFLDETALRHTLVAGSARWWLTPKLAVGPEFTYWRGAGNDRDQTLTGNLTYAFRASGLTPFMVVGAGLFRHSDRFFRDTFSSTEGSWTLGGGLRVPLRAGWYVATEVRTGWEPHLRAHVAVGRTF